MPMICPPDNLASRRRLSRQMVTVPAIACACLLTAIALSGTAAIGSPALPAATPPPGNPVAGKVVSSKCIACHSFAPGQNKLGPSLAGVVGRKAGAVPGFTYSPAMKASNLTWDAATLDRYLTNPRAVVPGTRMIFGGIPAPADRANLIAYLGAGAKTP